MDKGRKLVLTAPDKPSTTAEPSDKVFVLVPEEESQEVPIATGNVVRPRGSPKKSVPTLPLAQGEMSSVHQVPHDQVVKASSKQNIPVFLLPRFHLSVAQYR